MEEVKTLKQSVNGFRVNGFIVKKTKDGEKLKLTLEASIEDVTAGEFEVGDVTEALMNSMASDTEIGLSLFMKK